MFQVEYTNFWLSNKVQLLWELEEYQMLLHEFETVFIIVGRNVVTDAKLY